MKLGAKPWALATLILAGETIFLLPFVLPRVFRPTVLAALDITNLELGNYYAAYGLVAIGAYLLGGPLADRFAPHGLMAAALASTGLGGLYMATLPGAAGMLWLYAGWGLTTILLFWAAMLRGTRIAGGPARQGLAFGILDGGRGLVAAFIASAGVAVLSGVLPEGEVALGDGELLAAQREGFRTVVLAFTGLVFAVAVLVFVVLRRLPANENIRIDRIDYSLLLVVARRREVWLQALIILCAYSGYRVLDDVSLLAHDVLDYTDVEAARLGGLTLYSRPIAAIGAGLLADRARASGVSVWCFVLTAVGGAVMAFGPLGDMAVATVWLSIVLSCLGVYALRGLYFALTAEGGVPLALTGTAVGLVSVIGYLPDVYMGPLAGWLLDSYPGVAGHRLVFGLAVGFAIVGGIAAWGFGRASGILKHGLMRPTS